MKVITITNDAGRVFVVKRVDVGEFYGPARRSRINCPAPLIEFWDATYSNQGPIGQFVSRYYVSTLVEHAPELIRLGLSLQGGVHEWRVSAANMATVIDQLCGISA